MLLCDFHIHTTWSDGKVSLPGTVDLFGQAGFDVIAITDHVVHGPAAVNAVARATRTTIRSKTFASYLAAVSEEAERAREKYGMLVIPGVEISKNYLSAGKSAHLLVLDIREFIPASLDYDDIFQMAKAQGALTIACHPHVSSDIVRDTLHLWNNRRRYEGVIDAWEIANRNDVFAAVGLERYAYVASSDFHRPSHLYSWKTLLDCPKEIGAVKTCIRDNRGVAITLFRK